jgi:hypothetical protein
MESKRLKEQIKDVKKELKEKRKLFSTVALGPSFTDIKLIEKLHTDIASLMKKLCDLETKYKK